jgi:hypothetical protein
MTMLILNPLNVKNEEVIPFLANLNRKQQHTHLMLVKLYSSSVFGVTATTITVEVNIDNGLYDNGCDNCPEQLSLDKYVKDILLNRYLLFKHKSLAPELQVPEKVL